MKTRTRRYVPPRWEARLDGSLIGWVDEHRFANASSVFYFAVGLDLDTGKEHRLEGNTDRRERLEHVVAFQLDAAYRELILGRQRYSG